MKTFSYVLLAAYAAAQNRSRRNDAPVKGGALNDLMDETDISGFEKQQFLEYTARFGKNYDDVQEFQMRQNLWVEADNLIKSANRNSLFMTKHNRFSDLTAEEKKKILNLHQPVSTGRLPQDTEVKRVRPTGYVENSSKKSSSALERKKTMFRATL